MIFPSQIAHLWLYIWIPTPLRSLNVCVPQDFVIGLSSFTVCSLHVWTSPLQCLWLTYNTFLSSRAIYLIAFWVTPGTCPIRNNILNMYKTELFPLLCLPSYITDHTASLFTVLSRIPIVWGSPTTSLPCYTWPCMEWPLHMSSASLFIVYTTFPHPSYSELLKIPCMYL